MIVTGPPSVSCVMRIRLFQWRCTMRTYSRDWIAWTLVAAIVVIAATEYYVRQQTGLSTSEYAYKIVVTPERTTH